MPFDADTLETFVADDMPGYAPLTIGGIDYPALFRAPGSNPLGIASTVPEVSVTPTVAELLAVGTACNVGGIGYRVTELMDETSGMVRAALQVSS